MDMGQQYRQLTAQERDLIGMMCGKGEKLRKIADRLGRNVSTVSREIQRNGPKIRRRKYRSEVAQTRAKRRQQIPRRKKKMCDRSIWQYVCRCLEKGWSPVLISGRLEKGFGIKEISHEAIYQWIYKEGREYIESLPRKHRRRRRRDAAKKTRKYNIPSRVGIEERPFLADIREEVGHWEVDTAFFHHQREVLHVMAERKTRYTKLGRMRDITSKDARNVMEQQLRWIPKLMRKSFTYDNGRENVCQIYINKQFGTRSYFCEPGRSWEKGTVENTIGLIRRFMPKKAHFENMTDQDIKRVEDWLNDRPRKCLNFLTPREAYNLERRCCT